jgi:hypothetical protein
VTTDALAWVRAEMDAAEVEALAAREVDYAGCGVWEARGPYPAASGEADGVSRPRGNLRAEIGKDDVFLDAELPWGLLPHMARHDPAAVLRRIAADRKLLDECEEVLAIDGWEYSDAPDLAELAIGCVATGWGWTEGT